MDNDQLVNGHVMIDSIHSGQIPERVDSCDDSPEAQAYEISTNQAIRTFALMEAKSKAEIAELQKRLILQQFRPCKLYPTIIYHDGLRWVCAYGAMRGTFSNYLPDNADDIGVVAYGMSPEEATQNFDRMWIGMEDGEESDENV
jgi:hypothetical protein